MNTKVYIDGQSGTTGLKIYDRIAARSDLEMLRIDEDKRHDVEERRKFLNKADIVFLCLPDDSAREAVELIENPEVRVIDASTAHRTADDWDYGFPELSQELRSKISNSKRVANPGCHATGFISIVAPLIKMNIMQEDYPVTCFSLTGFSGGGKQMIGVYEDENKADYLYAPGIYGLNLQHKHIAEMKKITGLKNSPVFLPIVDDYYKGMATTVMLHNHMLKSKTSFDVVYENLNNYYQKEQFVDVIRYDNLDKTIYANSMAGSNKIKLVVCGNDEQTSITALFDNLGKGASGAAVQNMNIMLGLEENIGLL